jgi:protein involved in polysaccharide export with SLBB domain
LAGGFTEWAEKNDMVILRKSEGGPEQKIPVRFKDVLRKKGSKADELLYPGDTLIVP